MRKQFEKREKTTETQFIGTFCKQEQCIAGKKKTKLTEEHAIRFISSSSPSLLSSLLSSLLFSVSSLFFIHFVVLVRYLNYSQVVVRLDRHDPEDDDDGPGVEPVFEDHPTVHTSRCHRQTHLDLVPRMTILGRWEVNASPSETWT